MKRKITREALKVSREDESDDFRKFTPVKKKIKHENLKKNTRESRWTTIKFHVQLFLEVNFCVRRHPPGMVKKSCKKTPLTDSDFCLNFTHFDIFPFGSSDRFTSLVRYMPAENLSPVVDIFIYVQGYI